MAASKPTSSLFLVINNLHPFTLNQFLRTLTVVWVVPLSHDTLTAPHRLPESTVFENFELDSEPTPFGALVLDPSLYLPNNLVRGLTAAKFGRNQLSPSSIGFLPLHPG